MLAACAGNPPTWWNPSNSYGNSSSKKGEVRAVSQPRVVPTVEEEIPQEEHILPLPDSEYEEMILTPLQDEETEQATGSSSAQNVISPDEPTATDKKIPSTPPVNTEENIAPQELIPSILSE